MRFGAIPLVRPVGGLADTVVDATDATIAAGTATGFHFPGLDDGDEMEGIDRAVRFYRHDLLWRRLQRGAMAGDFGWEHSARAYMNLYAGVLRRRFESMMPGREEAIDEAMPAPFGHTQAMSA